MSNLYMPDPTAAISIKHLYGMHFNRTTLLDNIPKYYSDDICFILKYAPDGLSDAQLINLISAKILKKDNIHKFIIMLDSMGYRLNSYDIIHMPGFVRDILSNG